jgi:hypothetical protein
MRSEVHHSLYLEPHLMLLSEEFIILEKIGGLYDMQGIVFGPGSTFSMN